MTAIPATTLAALQLEDAHRACVSAALTLYLVAGSASDPELLRATERIGASLNASADELGTLRQQMQVAP